MTAAQMVEIHALCFKTPRPWTVVEFDHYLSDSNCIVLHEGKTGFLIGRLIAGEAEVLTLAVRPDARRRGVGTHLVTEFINTLRTNRAEQVFLEVNATNNAAIALYSAQGFTATGRRPKYYKSPNGDRIDALILCVDLNT